MKRRDVLKAMAATGLVGCGGDNVLTNSLGGPVDPSEPGPGAGSPIASNEFEQALPQPGFEEALHAVPIGRADGQQAFMSEGDFLALFCTARAVLFFGLVCASAQAECGLGLGAWLALQF